MYEITLPNISEKLSDNASLIYDENKDFLKNLSSLIKFKSKEDLQDEFASKCSDFTRKLEEEGYINEARIYMAICDMIWALIHRPDVLEEHQKFFNNLFVSFSELLSFRLINSDDYEAKHWECRIFLDECEDYFYTEVAIPSEKYDKSVLEEILSHLNGGL